MEESTSPYAGELAAFYRYRNYQPAWTSDDASRLMGEALVEVLRRAGQDGLSPERYRVAEMAARLEAAGRNDTADDRVALEMALTEAFFHYARDASEGQVSPATLHQGWESTPHTLDLPALLQEARTRRELASVAGRLYPPHAGYTALREALARYHRIRDEGGWPALNLDAALRAGDRSEAVQQLRDRLAVTEGSLPVSDAAVFDDTLEAAVRAFQQRHGLEADGIVGPQTLAALNVPVETRIRQIETSMERWRWLPRPPGQRFLLVNTAGGWLHAVEDDTTVLAMKVIVGKVSTPTPLFQSAIEGVILAPYWYVPVSIARNEILPRLGRDPGYLARNRIRRLPGGQLRQDPGPANPLGQLKFVFPNPFSIGLHDTPSRNLFAQRDCAYSHGCIRLEKPVDLALFALQGDPAWTRPQIEAVISRWKETEIPLPASIPVYVLYWTAWVDSHGTLHFRPDRYRHDLALQRAIDNSGSSISN